MGDKCHSHAGLMPELIIDDLAKSQNSKIFNHSSTRNSQPVTRNPQLATRNPQLATRNP
jgi:hypothetical protein